MNLLCGCFSIVFALNGSLQTAAYLIFAAAVFDFFDGFAARALKVGSPLGVQLDSLADMTSFGIAPSMMIFKMLSEASDIRYLPYAAFLTAVFSALRLAKFNIDERQTESFIGLPTPACSLFVAGSAFVDIPPAISQYVLLAVVPILCFLLVSEIPMFSLKFKSRENPAAFVKKYSLQLIFVSISAVLLAVFRFAGFSAVIGLYAALSIAAALRKRILKKPSLPE